jgi:hypothetical protein
MQQQACQPAPLVVSTFEPPPHFGARALVAKEGGMVSSARGMRQRWQCYLKAILFCKLSLGHVNALGNNNVRFIAMSLCLVPLLLFTP